GVGVFYALGQLLAQLCGDEVERGACRPFAAAGRRGVYRPCKRFHRLALEQVLELEAQAPVLGPGDDLQAEDRVPAKLEVIVAHPYPLDLEHLGPDRRQLPLGLVARRNRLTGRRKRARPPPRPPQHRRPAASARSPGPTAGPPRRGRPRSAEAPPRSRPSPPGSRGS